MKERKVIFDVLGVSEKLISFEMYWVFQKNRYHFVIKYLSNDIEFYQDVLKQLKFNV